MTPTVGRIVHFLNRKGDAIAAIVTAVYDDPTVVDLTVFNPGSDRVGPAVGIKEGTQPGDWMWPPLVT